MHKVVRNRWVFAIAALLSVALVASGCGQSGSGGGPAPSAGGPAGGGSSSGGAAAKGSIKVGILGSASGSTADMGSAMRNGALLAFEEVNASGGIDGRKIEAVAYDEEADAAKSSTLAKRLIDVDKVVAILGNDNSGTAIASVKASTAAQVPQIVPVAQSPEVLGDPPSKWAFRISPNNNHDIQGLINYMKGKKWQNVALVYPTSAYGLSGKKIFEAEAPKAGLKIVASEGFTQGATDLTPQVLNVQKAKPDVIFLWGLGAEGALFAKNKKAAGVQTPLMGGRGLRFAVFIGLGGDAVNGVVTSAAFHDTKPEAKAFLDKYKAKYGKSDNEDFSVLGYDAARLLIAALKKVGGNNAEDRAKIRDAIESLKDFPVTFGPPGTKISYGPDRHEGSAPEAVALVKVENGKWAAVND